MSVAVVGDKGAAFACRCLNVRIQTVTPNTAPPESVGDPAYTQVYVGEGIEIKHPQLTLRSRKRVSAIPDTNRYSRYTTLTCLSCNIPAYRVFQVITADVEGKDGPISPSEDYIEKEVMKSPNGWIEVSKDLLTGEAIIKAQSAEEYSPVYDLIVPLLAPSRSPAVRNISQESERSKSPSPATPSYFSHVKAVLPPPPFTPSHPVFLHLAQFAHGESQARRAAAENYVAEIIRQKTAEIEKGDEAIRQQIEAIWHRFRDSIKEAHAEALLAPRSTMRRSSRSRERERRSGRSISPASGAAVSVRDFVPVSVPARRTSPPPVRPSALSASLVTTTFHYPRAQRDTPSSQGSDTPDSESSKTLSTASGSSTLVQQPAADGVNIFQFRRNINDEINTQASYRYFRMQEEDIARERQQRDEAAQKAGNAQSDKKEATTSPSGDATVPATEPTASSSTKPETQQTNDNGTEQSDPNPPRGRQRKGKRKVTFDVEPDVVTMQKEAEPGREEVNEEETEDPREMIFSMEDLEGDEKKSLPAATLPLLEQPTIPRAARIGRARLQVMPEELASLRPSSLPAPSHIRPIRSQPGVDSSSISAMMLSLPQYSNPLTRRPPRAHGTKGTLSPTKDADGQRGSWSADGRSWQSFIRAVAPTSIPEESETETGEMGEGQDNVAKQASAPIPQIKRQDDRGTSLNHAGIPGSLPIRIHMKTTARQPLSLASYQPQSAIVEQQQQESEPAVPVNGKHKLSSTAIRKALYAERDRSRSMDPGTMDFTTSDEEDDEDDESSEDEGDRARIEAYLATGRGRRRALKILRVRSELPDSGMWRSLAS